MGSALIFIAFKSIPIIVAFYLLGGPIHMECYQLYHGRKRLRLQSPWGCLCLFVFGLVGTLGTFYSMAHSLPLDLLLPASGTGLLAVSVLHLNNMRDREEDLKHDKHTIAGYLGHERSKIYFALLSLIPFALFGTYALQHGFENPQYIF